MGEFSGRVERIWGSLALGHWTPGGRDARVVRLRASYQLGWCDSSDAVRWIVPTELTQALQGIGAALGPHGPSGTGSLDGPPVGTASGFDHAEEVEVDEPSLEDPAEALARARREAAGAAKEAEESTRVARRGSLGGSRGEAGAGAGGPGAGPMETGPAPTPEPEMPDEPTE